MSSYEGERRFQYNKIKICSITWAKTICFICKLTKGNPAYRASYVKSTVDVLSKVQRSKSRLIPSPKVSSHTWTIKDSEHSLMIHDWDLAKRLCLFVKFNCKKPYQSIDDADACPEVLLSSHHDLARIKSQSISHRSEAKVLAKLFLTKIHNRMIKIKIQNQIYALVFDKIKPIHE